MKKLDSLEGRYSNHLGLYAMTLWYDTKRYKLTYTDAETDPTPQWNRQTLTWRLPDITVHAVFKYTHLRERTLLNLEVEQTL